MPAMPVLGPTLIYADILQGKPTGNWVFGQVTQSRLIYSNRTVNHSIKAVRFIWDTLIEQSGIESDGFLKHVLRHDNNV